MPLSLEFFCFLNFPHYIYIRSHLESRISLVRDISLISASISHFSVGPKSLSIIYAIVIFVVCSFAIKTYRIRFIDPIQPGKKSGIHKFTNGRSNFVTFRERNKIFCVMPFSPISLNGIQKCPNTLYDRSNIHCEMLSGFFNVNFRPKYVQQ